MSNSTSNLSSNLQTLTQQYNNTLNQYQEVYEDYINTLNTSVNNGTNTNDFTLSTQGQQYQIQLQKLNNQLVVINKQMLIIIQSTPSTMNNINKQSKNQEKKLKKNYATLVKERDTINNMVNEYEMIDTATGYTNEVATSYYSRYIVLLFITILLFLLLFRYSLLSNNGQSGGGIDIKKDSIFLLSIMIIFMSLANIFTHLNILIFLAVVSIIYVIIKTKFVKI